MSSRNALIVLIVLLATFVLWRVLTWLFTVAPWIALPLLLLTAVFLMVLILVQRGKGGGLAGAFGGMGGQSAFGTKAGDAFTRITIIVAAIWIFLCVVSVRALTTTRGSGLNLGVGNAPVQKEVQGETSGDGEESSRPSGGGGGAESAPVSGEDTGSGTDAEGAQE